MKSANLITKIIIGVVMGLFLLVISKIDSPVNAILIGISILIANQYEEK